MSSLTFHYSEFLGMEVKINLNQRTGSSKAGDQLIDHVIACTDELMKTSGRKGGVLDEISDNVSLSVENTVA